MVLLCMGIRLFRCMYNQGEISIYRNNDVLIHRTIKDSEFEMCSYAMHFLNCYPIDDYYEIHGRNHDGYTVVLLVDDLRTIRNMQDKKIIS